MCSNYLNGQVPFLNPHLQLVWEDNFNSLDTSKWFIQDNFDHYGEKQVYIKDNVYVDSGILICELKNETYSCPQWAIEPNWYCVNQFNKEKPYNYTSGWIESKQAYNTQYGYIEAKIKFPFNPGLLPAFWTFVGEGVSNPTNAGEIDIAEMLGPLGSNMITTNIHRDYEGNESFYEEIIPWDSYNWEDWHTYAIEWSPNKLIWYVDKEPVRILLNHEIFDPTRLVFNIAVTPDDFFNPTFPYKMYVDYVKVYELKEDCLKNHVVCNLPLHIYDNKIKQSITIGNDICLNTVHSGQKYFFKATEEIIINNNLEVQLGGVLTLDILPCD
jgi:beta-glucanase (GH16 family)